MWVHLLVHGAEAPSPIPSLRWCPNPARLLTLIAATAKRAHIAHEERHCDMWSCASIHRDSTRCCDWAFVVRKRGTSPQLWGRIGRGSGLGLLCISWVSHATPTTGSPSNLPERGEVARPDAHRSGPLPAPCSLILSADEQGRLWRTRRALFPGRLIRVVFGMAKWANPNLKVAVSLLCPVFNVPFHLSEVTADPKFLLASGAHCAIHASQLYSGCFITHVRKGR